MPLPCFYLLLLILHGWYSHATVKETHNFTIVSGYTKEKNTLSCNAWWNRKKSVQLALEYYRNFHSRTHDDMQYICNRYWYLLFVFKCHAGNIFPSFPVFLISEALACNYKNDSSIFNYHVDKTYKGSMSYNNHHNTRSYKEASL